MHSRDVLAPPPDVVARAAAWLVQMQEGQLTVEEEKQLHAWRLQHTDHERAWQAAMQLKDMMGRLPGDLSQPVLGRRRLDRRQLLLSIAALAAALPVVWTAHHQLPLLTSDYRTATGEQQRITLPDGSELQLNTASSVNVAFDAQQRLIRLQRGEIYIATAADSSARKRPFIVSTPAGNIRALGTGFTVRTLANDITRISVYEHAVAITTADTAMETTIQVGQQVHFDRKSIGVMENNNQWDAAWTRGQIIADNQRLDDFIAELARYHPGILRCDPAVADLRISGVFQLKNTQHVLNTIAGTLPVGITRMTDYWVTITLP